MANTDKKKSYVQVSYLGAVADVTALGMHILPRQGEGIIDGSH